MENRRSCVFNSYLRDPPLSPPPPPSVNRTPRSIDPVLSIQLGLAPTFFHEFRRLDKTLLDHAFRLFVISIDEYRCWEHDERKCSQTRGSSLLLLHPQGGRAEMVRAKSNSTVSGVQRKNSRYTVLIIIIITTPEPEKKRSHSSTIFQCSHLMV